MLRAECAATKMISGARTPRRPRLALSSATRSNPCALDNNGDPGIVALLTGDGADYAEGRNFHSTLERMHKRGWRVEVLSWVDSCNRGMRRWAETNGVFVPLDDHYETITFREPSCPGHEFAPARDKAPLDLSRRHMA